MQIDFVSRAADNIDNLSDGELEAIRWNSGFRDRVIKTFRTKHGYGSTLEPYIKDIERLNDVAPKENRREIAEYGDEKTDEILFTATREEQLIGENLIRVVNDDLVKLVGKDNDMLYHLSSNQFEQLMMDIISKMDGFSDVYKTQQSHDKGVDVVAYFKNPFGSKSKIIIGCKKHKAEKAVSLDAIRALNSSQLAHKAPLALFATTGRFTRTIDKFIAEQIVFGQMDLADAKKILQWINGR